MLSTAASISISLFSVLGEGALACRLAGETGYKQVTVRARTSISVRFYALGKM